MQTPAPFGYERATSVDDAIALLERLGPEARLIAGGHSLLPMMKLRLARPEHLIDINELADELSYIRVEGDALLIGAMTRHAELLESAVAGEHFRIFHDAERVIADPIVRNRGTVGGSIGQADPSEDLSAVFSALRATIVDPRVRRHPYGAGAGVLPRPVRDRRRRRRDDHRDPRADPTRGRQRVPEGRAARRRLGGRRRRRLRVARRRHVRRGRHRAHRRRRRRSSVPRTPRTRCADTRCPPTRSTPPASSPPPSATRPTDQRGPADYKRHLAGELTKRALRIAVARAKGEEV